MRRLHVLALIALSAVGVLGSVGSAGAAPGDPFQYKYSFGIAAAPKQVAVNHQTGNILTFRDGLIYQYDPNGNPVDFPALGSSTISVETSSAALTIDNTGGSTQGSIYLLTPSSFWSYSADGSPADGENPHDLAATSALPESASAGTIVVQPDGGLRLIYLQGRSEFNEIRSVFIDQSGQPLGSSEPFPAAAAGGLFDELGNSYVELGRKKYDVENNYAYAGETGFPRPLNTAAESSPVFDPSTNDIYLRRGNQTPNRPLLQPIGSADSDRSPRTDAAGHRTYCLRRYRPVALRLRRRQSQRLPARTGKSSWEPR